MASLPSPEIPRVLLARVPGWTMIVARQSTDAIGPLVVMDNGRVVDRCELAADHGVVPGLKLREVQLRCPAGTLIQHSPSLEAEAFEQVIEIIEQLVPVVHIVRPGVVAMPAGGPARFYGDEWAAADVLWGALASNGYAEATVAVADGLFAAEQVARLGERIQIIEPGGSPAFLAGLEVDVLGDAKLVNTLCQLGLRRLGQFAALKVGEVAARFGPAAADLHRMAQGLDSTALIPHVIERNNAVGVSFEEELVISTQVVAGARTVVEQLMGDLASRGLVCTQVCIMVRTSAGVSERSWRHPWQFTAKDLLSRLAWQLDEITIDSEPVSGVQAVQFIPRTRPAVEQAEGLFGDRPPEYLIQILTSLQERHGPGAVLTPALRGGRLLNERCLLTPFGSVPRSAGQRRGDPPWPGSLPGPSPSIVLSRPRATLLQGGDGEALRLVDGELTGEPTWLATAPGHRRRVVAWAGPWPVRQRWWTERATFFSRVQVVTDDQQAWLLASGANSWWIEARYD